jgi:signal transduction histidine kinase
MELKRRSTLIYGLLIGVWLLVVAWQIEEHSRVQEAAKRTLRSRSTEIGNDLSAVIRALSFRGRLLQSSLEPVLNERVNGRTNELNVVGNSGVLIYIALLNTAGEPIAAAGDTNRIPTEVLSEGEYNPDGYWEHDSVTFVNPIEGASLLNPAGGTNPVVILPPPSDFTNSTRFDGRAAQSTNADDATATTNPPATSAVSDNATNIATNNELAAATNSVNRPRGRGARGRPPWLRGMSDADYSALIAKHELHGLVVTLSTENFQAISTRDLWLRGIIILFAGISAAGVGLARRNTMRTSVLQLRLVRASELNSHLKEMNLAAAGLAHETRNPLNIIRGMAQMLSKESTAPVEIRDKARAIVDETDKVTSQLTEFINYSRPREVRRSKVALNNAISEVVRTLNRDIEEKKLRVDTLGEPLVIEADEQMLRQILFNLLHNGIQAIGENGVIQIQSRRGGSGTATLEIRDDGPGVPPERRREIFKPYFTTHQKGTGLGLAVVQQMVLAHGWEIECLPNEPKGAIFRISHLKLAA